jgi:uncharacterized membrane protein
MKTRVSYVWEQLRATYWFIPVAMVALAVVLSTGSLLIDRAVQAEGGPSVQWLYSGGAAEARALLSTIAGSMINVAGVTFSITIVTLSLASSQFGSRLLRNFMRDTGNQVVLGTFIATFVYALLVLQATSEVEGRVFVPQISVTIGMLLAITSLAVLIYFIHHVSASIQAENVIAQVGRDLDGAIERWFPGQGERPCEGQQPVLSKPSAAQFSQPGRPVPAAQTGYVQAVNREGLMHMATQEALVIHVKCRPGDFVVEASDLAVVWPVEAADKALIGRVADAFILGVRRLRLQDVEFAINQLVELALRALSPGINDPFTAIHCIDRLGASLARLAERGVPAPHHCDSEGHLRLITEVVTFTGIVDASFNQIRQHARGDVAVTIRLLEALAIVAARARNKEQRAALQHQAEMVCRSSQEALPEGGDREDVERRYRVVLRTLEGAGERGSGGAEELRGLMNTTSARDSIEARVTGIEISHRSDESQEGFVRRRRIKQRAAWGALTILLVLAHALGAALAGCAEPTPEPGVITGRVAIRPLSPVEEGEPMPTPQPDLYEDRVILIYGPGGGEVIRRAEIDAEGVYREELPPGTYVVDIVRIGPVSAAGLPRTIEVASGETVRVDVVIDTGIR